MDIGFDLVADDRVDIIDGCASAPAPLAGLLEVRGLGILRFPYVARARLALALRLGQVTERLPEPATEPRFDLPLLPLDPRPAAAPRLVALALDCALGRRVSIAGAFA